jgi:VanZ family protein
MEESKKREERALLWTEAVTLLLLVPVPAGFEADSFPRFGRLHADKWIHAGLFFLLARAWLAAVRSAAGRAALALALAAGLYGGLLELVQGTVGRDPSWGEFAADLAGAALAGLLARRARFDSAGLPPIR